MTNFNDVSCPICGHAVEYDSSRKIYTCTNDDCNWRAQIDDEYTKAVGTMIRIMILNQPSYFTRQSIYEECQKQHIIHPNLIDLIKGKLDVLEDNGLIYYRNGRYELLKWDY